jgi:hypothetical protein
MRHSGHLRNKDLQYLSRYMKQLKTAIVGLLLLAPLLTTQAQNPVGKNLHEIIGMWGDNFKRLTDASGMHILQYKRVIAKDTVSDVLYLEGFTCVKEVSIRPLASKSQYIDSLNQQYKPAGPNSWLSKDSAFITVSTRDGFLDITSFSAAYYKKIVH